MGLFNSDRRKTSQHNATTIIAEASKLNGELILCGDLQVDGHVNGTVRSEKTVTISPTGSIEGELYADKAVVNGFFNGDIFARNVEILESGSIQGNVTSAEFTIQKGGLFLGSSKTVSGEEVSKLSGKAAEPKAFPKPVEGKTPTAVRNSVPPKAG